MGGKGEDGYAPLSPPFLLRARPPSLLACTGVMGKRSVDPPLRHAVTKVSVSATMLIVSWKVRNLRMFSLMERPQRTDATMDAKRSSCSSRGEARRHGAPEILRGPGAPHPHHDDDVGRLLGDLRARDAHGEADVSGAQRGRVVGSVARDSDDLSPRLERRDKQVLVGGRGASKHGKRLDGLRALRVAEAAEGGALHDDAARAQDAALQAGREGETWSEGKLAQPPDTLPPSP